MVGHELTFCVPVSTRIDSQTNNIEELISAISPIVGLVQFYLLYFILKAAVLNINLYSFMDSTTKVSPSDKLKHL